MKLVDPVLLAFDFVQVVAEEEVEAVRVPVVVLAQVFSSSSRGLVVLELSSFCH